MQAGDEAGAIPCCTAAPVCTPVHPWRGGAAVGLLLQAVTGPASAPAELSAVSAPVAEAVPQPAPTKVEDDATIDPTVTPQPAAGGTSPQASAVEPAQRAGRRPAARARAA